jgi:hypothetical protein
VLGDSGVGVDGGGSGYEYEGATTDGARVTEFEGVGVGWVLVVSAVGRLIGHVD